MALIGLIVGVILFWNKFVKMKCKKCKSTNYRQIGRQLLSSKIVKKQGSGGQSTADGAHARNIRFTDESRIDTYQITYECNDCKNIWTKNKKETTELGRTTTQSSHWN